MTPPLQPFGFVDDFPSKFYLKPESTRLQSNEASFLFTPMMKKYLCERRNLDLINQCRYLAAKKGMSKQELKKSIRQDEIEGKNYVLSEEFLATFKGRCQDESYIDPHGMNFIGGCWHLPPSYDTTPEDYYSTSSSSSSTLCPGPSSMISVPFTTEEESSEFVTFTQPGHPHHHLQVGLSADKHEVESFDGAGAAAVDMKKSPLLYHHRLQTADQHQPILSGRMPLVNSSSCRNNGNGGLLSRPVSTFGGYFNEMFDDYGSSLEDVDLAEYLMDTANYINRMSCCDQYFCNDPEEAQQQQQQYQHQRPLLSSAGAFIHPAVPTREIHNFSTYAGERQNNDDHVKGSVDMCSKETPATTAADGINKNEESHTESVKKDSPPQEIALKNYFPYSDDDSQGAMSDYSTTDETVVPLKVPTEADAGDNIEDDGIDSAKSNNELSREVDGAFGMRKIHILKKSDSSIFGSRDEYGKIVDESNS